MHLYNPSDEEITIPQGTVIGHLDPADASKGIVSLGDDSEELKPFPFSCAEHESDGVDGQTDKQQLHNSANNVIEQEKPSRMSRFLKDVAS